jgi:hypothetical protein
MSMHRLTHVVSCKEASLLLSEAEDRRLSMLERLKLRVHLSLCDACTRFAQQIAFLRKAMKTYRS